MQKNKKQKHCFVVMGFGEKTDYVTGRKLNLNQSYQLLIKPVVEEKGFVCLRADEIKHSGIIDEIMYRQLLQADVVIADLSTSNLNAFYELGVRHALRPFTTIVISEDKMAYPFNLTHISIEPYQHLGADIGFTEVQRFRKVLGEKIDAILKSQENDSPIYTFLEDLIPPSLQEKTAKALKNIRDAVQKGKEERMQKEQSDDKPPEAKDAARKMSLSRLTEQGEAALKKQQFIKAKELFQKALDIHTADNKKNGSERSQISHDPYIIHRLAFATYRSAKPNVVAALKEALLMLEKLDLDHTNDPETVALAGTIEKKLYERKQGVEHLSRSILYHERGYYLLNNLHNTINLAYMLNCRADSILDETKEEKIADLVNAKRIRERVLMICKTAYDEILAHEKKPGADTNSDKELMEKYIASNNEQKFWIWSNKAEAYFGLGQFEEYEKCREEAKQISHETWMLESLDNQIKNLSKLLEKQGHLMNPPWEKD